MDITTYDELNESREILQNVTKSIKKTLDSAKYLQNAGEEFVRRYNQAINSIDPSGSTDSEEIQEEKQKSETKSEEWRRLLFQRNCPDQFENEPHWYKVLKRYRPSRSLYDGLQAHTPKPVVMVDASVQTDFTFVRKCFELGMEKCEKEEERVSGMWKLCCCGRQ